MQSFDIICASKKFSGNSIKKETSNRTNKNVIGVNYPNKVEIKKLIIDKDAKSISISLPEVKDSVGLFDWYEFFWTNELEKIDIGIRSRCEILHVPPCEPDVFFPYAKAIIQAEGYDIDNAALTVALDAVYEQRPDNRRYYQTLDEILRKATMQ